MTVKPGATLTIESDVSVNFPNGMGLIVETGGTLVTQGTSDEPVILKPLVYPGGRSSARQLGRCHYQ